MTLSQFMSREIKLTMQIASLVVSAIIGALIVVNVFHQLNSLERFLDVTLPQEIEALVLSDRPLDICQRLQGVHNQFSSVLGLNFQLNVELRQAQLCSVGTPGYFVMKETSREVLNGQAVLRAKIGFETSLVTIFEIALFFLVAFGSTAVILANRLQRKIEIPLAELRMTLGSKNGSEGRLAIAELDQIRQMAIDGRKKEAELTQAKFEIQSALEQGRLARQVAHDIRSPISALNLTVSTLNNLPEAQKNILRSSIERINIIASDLMRYSKSNSRKEDAISLRDISVMAYLILEEKRAQYPEFSLVVNVEGDENVRFRASKADLARAFANIFQNSIEAATGNEKLEIKILARHQGKQIEIIIADNGKGIAPEHLSQIGTEGFSFGKENSQSGTGLGIYQVKQFVEHFGGRFKISSNVGFGTEISMTFQTSSQP